MKLHRMSQRAATGYTTFGCIWEKGRISEKQNFRLRTEDGSELPMQSMVTAYWPDHSVKWTSHTADSCLMGDHVEVLPTDPAQPGEASAASMIPENDELNVREEADRFVVDAGYGSMEVKKQGFQIFENFCYKETQAVSSAALKLILEEPVEYGVEGISGKLQTAYSGEISDCVLEENGPLKCVFRLSGTHVSANGKSRKLPFILRLTVRRNDPKIDLAHTFLYDGNVSRDFLKGIGLELESSLSGEAYNRHIRMLTDHGSFHEPAVLLSSWRPRIDPSLYRAQIQGTLLPTEGDVAETCKKAMEEMPVWSAYRMVQDSASHFVIEKKISEKNCCYIQALHGTRGKGILAVSGENGGFAVGLKNFWEKYPAELEVEGLEADTTKTMIWFWSPQVEAFDYRHYATRGYSQAYYEGFDEMGATPYGIANTSECSIEAVPGGIAGERQLECLYEEIQKPAVFIGTPEYYHELRAFGYWSLKKTDTPMETWLEDQIDSAVEFYKNEIKVRNWYGFYNYGDIMHTYDGVRHSWKYDMGGYAWQNTELVPTLWLWLSFLRTGREDIYTLAEAMSRHCSDVDMYHFGPYKGIGSRHNVRHWGCSCKEARIGMAGHHRFYYYLTGDGRMRDVFDDDKDADESILNIDPMRYFYEKEKMVYPTHARSGPDWSSFCSNWMTQWERFDDTVYKEKIQTGVSDLKQTPLKLVSGSDFEYDPKSSHLRYIGERAAGGTHLQICMGAAQVWLELSLLLEDPEWTKMLADYGRFYYLPRQQQIEESRGLVNDREFSLPFMASGIAAFAAYYLKDSELARKTWQILMRAMISDCNRSGFERTNVHDAANCAVLEEIPWISTNFVSQWCLNVIMVLDFIREELPNDWEQMNELMKDMPEDGFHRA